MTTKFQITNCGLSQARNKFQILLLIVSGSFCVAAEKIQDVPATEEDIYDYRTMTTDTDVRRREAGLSKEEKEGLQAVGSANRGSVRGAARGAARGSVRGAAREVARGEVRGNLQESQIESLYADYEDTLNLLPDRIEPISPRGVGYTQNGQPNLYFYMDKPSSKPIEFTLNRKDELDPVIISYIDVSPETGVINPGIHSISLEALDITLEESIEYEWFVTIVVDVVERSGDIVASGVIVNREHSENNTEPTVRELPDYADYSLGGYWYDAVDRVLLTKNENVLEDVAKDAESSQNFGYLFDDDETVNFSSLKGTSSIAPQKRQQLIHWLQQEKLPSTLSFLGKF